MANPFDEPAPNPFDAPATAAPTGKTNPFDAPPLTQLKQEAPPGYERVDGNLQPAGLVDPAQFTPTAWEEDRRRAGKFIDEAPQKLATGAMDIAEKLTDLPITRMYARGLLDANKMDVPGPIGQALPTAEQAVQAITPPSTTKHGSNWESFLGAFDTEGARPGASDPSTPDFTMAGVRPDQVANMAAHNVIGRPTQAFQQGPGQAIGQVGMAAMQPAIQGSPAPQGGGAMGGGGSDVAPTEQPLTQPGGGPEAREMLAREMLSFYAGRDFAMGYDTAKYKSAVDQLEAEYGTNGAAFAQSFAKEIGGLPVYMMVTGAGELAAEPAMARASALTKGPGLMTKVSAKTPAVQALTKAATMEGVVEGATQGMLQSAAKGEDIFTGAGYGALLGGVIGWTAGTATAKKQAMAMSKDFHAGLMLSRQSTNDFLKELDTLIQAERQVGPHSLDPPKTQHGVKGFEQLAIEGGRSPDFDVKIVSGEPTKPLGSYTTIDDQGRLVMRDIEVQAVRPTRRQASRPSEAVPVERKPTIVQKSGPRTAEGKGPGALLTAKGGERAPVTPKSTSVGEGLQVVVKVRDTPIADAAALERLSTQEGRRMLPVMQDQAATNIENAWMHKAQDNRVEGGTPHYMAPEQGKVYGGRFLQQRMNKLDETQLTPSADTKPRGIILQADADGVLSATVIRPDKPIEPGTWQMKGGDTVLVDGQAPGTVIGDVDPGAASSRITVNLKGGGQVQVSPAQVTHTPREFYRPEHGGKPLVSAKPGQLVDDRTQAIVKGIEQGTDVPTMMKVSGRADPVWAAAALRDMESRGLLFEQEPGLFVPTAVNRKRPKVGPQGTPDPAGYAVFIGTGGPNDRGEIGILRGKDPRNKGNWLIERPDLRAGELPDPTAGAKFAKTRIESIPEDQLRSMHPVGLAKKADVDPAIDMYGWNKPMPPQFYQMSKATQGDQELMTKAWSKVNTTPGFFQRSTQGIKEAFAGAMHTAAPELRKSKAQQLFSLAGMMRSEGLTRANMLAKQLELGTAASQELTKVLEATRSRTPGGQPSLNQKALQAWVQKYPKEAKAALDDFRKMTKEADSYSQFLASRGVANIDDIELARAAGLEEEYLTRTYQAFLMPRQDWAKYARENMTTVWDDSLRWLYENRPNHQNDFGTTAAEFDEILRLDNPIAALEQKGYIKAEGAKKLKTRLEVPEPIRRLLGEHKDAAIRLGFGTAYQRQLVKSIEGWDAISAHPQLWSPGWRPDMTLKVPDLPTYGNARNGFVPDNPTTRGLLGDRGATEMTSPNAVLRAVGWAGRKWKAAHTVYNQVSWFNNVVRNMKGVLLSGGFTGPEDIQGFRDAARMLMDYSKDPTIYGPNKLLVEAMDFDAVGPGLAGAELGLEQRNFTSKMLRVFEKQRRGPNPLLDAFAEAREAAMSVPEKIHNGYDFADKLAKFGSYLNLRRQFIAQGYGTSDAAAMASLRVNESFQNFLQTPSWARGVSTNMALVAPFMTSKLEDMRVNATAVKRVLSGQEPDLIFRLGAMGAMFGGATFLANNVRRANGISDQEDQEQFASLPMRIKERHPFLIGSLDYDSKGRRTYTDLTPYEDLLMAFRGNLNDPLLARIIFNNALDIVGEQSLMGDVVRGVGEQSGAITPGFTPGGPRPDQQGPISLVQRYGQGFVPQGLMNVLRSGDRMDPSGKLLNNEPMTPGQAGVHAMTGTVDAITGPRTNAQSAMERAGYAMDAEKNIKAAAKESALAGDDAERMGYKVKANTRKLKQDLQKSRPLK